MTHRKAAPPPQQQSSTGSRIAFKWVGGADLPELRLTDETTMGVIREQTRTLESTFFFFSRSAVLNCFSILVKIQIFKMKDHKNVSRS